MTFMVSFAVLDALSGIGNAPAFRTLDGQVLSGAKFRQTVLKFVANLQERGVSEGDCIYPNVGNRDVNLMLQLAGMAIGADVLFAPMPEAFVTSGMKLDYAIGRAVPDLPDTLPILFDHHWTKAEPGELLRPGKEGRIIVSSSGSTGAPKFMATDGTRFPDYFDSQNRLIGAPEGARLITIPLFSLFGYSYFIQSLLSGQPAMGTAGTVEETLVAAHEFDVIDLLATPPILSQITTRKEQGLPCPNLKRILFGGASIEPSLLNRAFRAFPDAEFVVICGMTEVGVASGGALSSPDMPHGWSGKVNEDFKFRFSDQGSYPEYGPTAGRMSIWLPERNRIDGYFGAEPIYDEDGWFHTSDIASLSEDRILTMHGRDDFVINLGGVKVMPEVIEAILSELDGVNAVAATGLSGRDEQLGILVVADKSFDPNSVAEALGRRFGSDRSLVLKLGLTIPELPGGKIDRQSVAALF